MATEIDLPPFRVPVNADGSFLAFGQGTSGTVTRAVDTRPGGGAVALKSIPVTLREEDRDRVIQQLEALYTGQHPNVTGFLGATFYPPRSSILIACEFMDLRSFKDVMSVCKAQDKGAGWIPEEVVGFVSGRVLDGLVYMHRERKQIHRDIKPSNILINSRGEVKICDFGMSTQLQNTLDPANTWVGSTTYMSPERISGLQYIWNSDIWSLGISLVEIATGCFPYQQPGQQLELVDLLDRIVDNEPPSLPETFGADFRDFIALTLVKRVEERPHAEMLVGHPFVIRCQLADLSEWLGSVTTATSAAQAT
eukprot:CAMPEP_0179452182 /NCGR_PEP_ID=MMETSP0799-20121207/36091_1 /TAXON_ID=46947 /ORGANISM="Geminigera cryophila, Strain CCMP2564" /LENGTH=308 /DNA_ID=CAMNT_0021247895 /DNA_START=126 /DNA_END=1052 /DNA_ORIENTATION=-